MNRNILALVSRHMCRYIAIQPHVVSSKLKYRDIWVAIRYAYRGAMYRDASMHRCIVTPLVYTRSRPPTDLQEYTHGQHPPTDLQECTHGQHPPLPTHPLTFRTVHKVVDREMVPVVDRLRHGRTRLQEVPPDWTKQRTVLIGLTPNVGLDKQTSDKADLFNRANDGCF